MRCATRSPSAGQVVSQLERQQRRLLLEREALTSPGSLARELAELGLEPVTAGTGRVPDGRRPYRARPRRARPRPARRRRRSRADAVGPDVPACLLRRPRRRGRVLVVGGLAQVQVLQHERLAGRGGGPAGADRRGPRSRAATSSPATAASWRRSLERVSVYVNPRQVAPRAVGRSRAQARRRSSACPSAEHPRAASRRARRVLLPREEPRPGGRSHGRRALRQRGIGTSAPSGASTRTATLAGPVIGFVDGEGVGQAGLEGFLRAHAARRPVGIPPAARRQEPADPARPPPREGGAGRRSRSAPPSTAASRRSSSRSSPHHRPSRRARRERGGPRPVRPARCWRSSRCPSYDPARPGDAPADSSPQPGRRDRARARLDVQAVHRRGGARARRPARRTRWSTAPAVASRWPACFIRDHAKYGCLTGPRPPRALVERRHDPHRPPDGAGSSSTTSSRRFGFGRPTGVELPGRDARHLPQRRTAGRRSRAPGSRSVRRSPVSPLQTRAAPTR